jgi:hypothetical protein
MSSCHLTIGWGNVRVIGLVLNLSVLSGLTIESIAEFRGFLSVASK